MVIVWASITISIDVIRWFELVSSISYHLPSSVLLPLSLSCLLRKNRCKYIDEEIVASQITKTDNLQLKIGK